MDERRRRFEAQALPHLDAAVNLARWLARSPADADDVVQDAMLRAFRAFDGFRGSDAKPWLLAIVRNCWRNQAGDRKRRGHVPLPEHEDAESGAAIVDDGASPEALAANADERRKLDGVIATLPEEFREVLVLREMEDLSYRDIAEVTGAPIGTVMSRLSRARALLREKWLGQVEGARDAVS
ncbi:MAG TPA: sigma-70 family RNA polymerase sigma factor [Rhizomicrobium sp.]|nr:sigma-70 family RNA polymerase sigma factor [Rhizomicrobium sp.]